jgi:hypothetical protein
MKDPVYQGPGRSTRKQITHTEGLAPSPPPPKAVSGRVGLYMISSPCDSSRAIWIPKHLLTNLKGPNKQAWITKIV